MKRTKAPYRRPWMLALVLGVSAGAHGSDLRPRAAMLDGGAPPQTHHPLTETLHIGGRLELEYLLEREYDLRDERPDRLSRLTLFNPSLALSWRPDESWSLYGNLEWLVPLYLKDEAEQGDPAPRLTIDKLFADHRRDHLLLRLGRQRIKDPREWLIDDTLDGVRLTAHPPGLTITAAWLRERAFPEELLDGDDIKPVDHLWLHFDAHGNEERKRDFYLVIQNDRRRDERSTWIALHLQDEYGDTTRWLLAAVSRTQKRDRGGTGLGFDVGATHRLRKRPRIYLYGKFAFGSGDPDDVDLGFRQTDLQDNSAKFGGVTRFAYYGEVLDPELSNLAIATIGVGIRPTRNASIDLIAHRYRQHHLLDELRESDLQIDPNGDSREIGSGLDLVIGYRIRGRLRFEGVFGLFDPGTAFDFRDPATLVKLEMRYNL